MTIVTTDREVSLYTLVECGFILLMTILLFRASMDNYHFKKRMALN
jgi:hypothetical protein